MNEIEEFEFKEPDDYLAGRVVAIDNDSLIIEDDAGVLRRIKLRPRGGEGGYRHDQAMDQGDT